jgi:hypothetical protein
LLVPDQRLKFCKKVFLVPMSALSSSNISMVCDISFSEADVSRDASKSIVRPNRVSGTRKKIARKLSPDMIAQSQENHRHPRSKHRYSKCKYGGRGCLTLYDEACNKGSDGITTIKEDDVYAHLGPSLVQVEYILFNLAEGRTVSNLSLH